MTKRSVGSASTAKLEALGAELVEATKQRKHWEGEEARIKAAIAEITARFALPIKEGKSEYLNLSTGSAIRVTHPAPRVRKILTHELYRLLCERLGNLDGEANQVFIDVVVLPKTCEIDVDAWSRYVENEMVVDSLLRQALEPETEAPKPNVQLTSTKVPE